MFQPCVPCLLWLVALVAMVVLMDSILAGDEESATVSGLGALR